MTLRAIRFGIFALTLIAPASARAELRHVEIKTLGMD
jgi:hypothetical protein